MRLLVFFDLPMETPRQRRSYAQFRKWLLKDGYIMLQKSVYSKLLIDGKMAAACIDRLRKNRPHEGLVQALRVTEKQFASMAVIAGNALEQSEIADTERLVVL